MDRAGVSFPQNNAKRVVVNSERNVLSFARPVGAYSRRAFPNRFPAPVAPLFGFEVAVLSSDLKMANAILQKLGDDT